MFYHGITNDYNIFLRNFAISYFLLNRFESLLAMFINTLLPSIKVSAVSITVSVFVFVRRFVCFHFLIFATLFMDFIVCFFLFFCFFVATRQKWWFCKLELCLRIESIILFFYSCVTLNKVIFWFKEHFPLRNNISSFL